eukprot:CAMPEP_0178425760 /NCGR_PEP_ID=MMETSP0689_2-20121128/28886_1 /TAXON_ID=160604 /ORGANISM="Amphidinium massartii, Strain CS-259" /LENGTH=68 /DNA_ID=CAMNT_0020047427 /DNA_START=665 /DNA_END=871 /DNA_ORIENTATION=+
MKANSVSSEHSSRTTLGCGANALWIANSAAASTSSSSLVKQLLTTTFTATFAPVCLQEPTEIVLANPV